MRALINILTVHNIMTIKHAQQAVSVQNSRSWKQIQAKVSSQVNSLMLITLCIHKNNLD